MIVVVSSLAAASDPSAAGLELFVRTWVPDDPRAAGGDGLGPLHNEFSCVACHAQGGVGGAGGPHADVHLRVPVGEAPVVLHRYGADRAARTDARRNTPALFGAGLLDAVPDEVVAAGARRSTRFPEISGEVSRVDGEVGRFGWKGDVASLRDFVVQACAVELGLELEAAGRPGELRAQDVEALTAYVASLPAPRREVLPGAERGRDVFHAIGCEECHRERLGDVTGVYSDLLLHDLGADLSDVAAGYYGSWTPSRDVARRWRTPPLWGLRDSGPWLHDGSATTLTEAIRRHGGEARAVIEAWRALPEPDQDALELFLLSLAAP